MIDAPSVEEDVCEIEEVELTFGPSQGRIQPPEPFEINALLGHVALVDNHCRPLSTLAFVACEGVREFDLKRLVARVGIRGFVDFGLAPEMRMVSAHGIVQGLSLRT